MNSNALNNQQVTKKKHDREISCSNIAARRLHPRFGPLVQSLFGPLVQPPFGHWIIQNIQRRVTAGIHHCEGENSKKSGKKSSVFVNKNIENT